MFYECSYPIRVSDTDMSFRRSVWSHRFYVNIYHFSNCKFKILIYNFFLYLNNYLTLVLSYSNNYINKNLSKSFL